MIVVCFWFWFVLRFLSSQIHKRVISIVINQIEAYPRCDCIKQDESHQARLTLCVFRCIDILNFKSSIASKRKVEFQKFSSIKTLVSRENPCCDHALWYNTTFHMLLHVSTKDGIGSSFGLLGVAHGTLLHAVCFMYIYVHRYRKMSIKWWRLPAFSPQT